MSVSSNLAPSHPIAQEPKEPLRPEPGRSRIAAAIGLGVIVCIQLMVVLDATVVNVALPHIQTSLGFSTTTLSWVINAYMLTFGGLLLLGARAGDILGRRAVLLAGVALFTAASLAGGFASTPELLLIARAGQGVGAASAAPQTLVLLTTMFSEGAARTRALGIYAAVSIGGSGVGLVLGGMLTDWLSWRWVFFINIPFGAALLIFGPRFLARTVPHPGAFDLPGSLTGTLGMTGLVYGFVRAGDRGWSDPQTLLAFVLGALLLVSYVMIEARAVAPITPLRLFRHRNRTAAFVARLCLVAGMTGVFFFLTLFMQQVLGLNPLQTGLGFLPLTAVLFLASQISARILAPRLQAKTIMTIGLAISTVALIWLTQISADSGYTFVLIPLLLFGIGNGLAFVQLTVVALEGVADEDAGAASGLVNVMQQVGGSLGLSILITIFGTATRGLSGPPQQVLTHGFSHAFVGSAVFAALTLLIIVVVVKAGPRRLVDPSGVSVPENSVARAEAEC